MDHRKPENLPRWQLLAEQASKAVDDEKLHALIEEIIVELDNFFKTRHPLERIEVGPDSRVHADAERADLPRAIRD